MKVTNEVFEQMKSDIRTILEHHNLMNLDYNTLSDGNIYSIWWRVHLNKISSTTVKIDGIEEINQNVDYKPNGERLFEYNPYSVHSPCGTNDKTILTAIKRAVKEVLSK